jgi:signal transduction histidine kinase
MMTRESIRRSEPFHAGWRSSALLAFAASAITAVMWLIGWLPPVERATGDLLVRVTGPGTEQPPQVIAVLIDDQAVADYGPLPWPRERLARLISSIVANSPQALVIDMILSEPGDPGGDQALADALAVTPHVLAAALDLDGGWLLPLEEFGGTEVAAHAYGEVGPDGVVRTIAATKQTEGLALPALALAAARGLRPEIPVDVGAELRPEFRPAPQHIPSIGASDALGGRLSAIDVRDRIVLIGISATGAGDQFVVPTGPRHTPVAGVLAHASATSSILGERLLRIPKVPFIAIAAFVFAFGVQAIRNRHGAFDIVRFSGLVGGLILIAIFALRHGLVLLPVASLAATLVVSALLREAIESRAAQAESGRLLHSLLVHTGISPRSNASRTAAGRLQALQRLQKKVLREDVTRQALLAGMEDGVVMWGSDGAVLEANAAAKRLLGAELDLDAVMADSQEDDGHQIVALDRRELSVHTADLDAGRLTIIRDVTAERSLARRRREMQRLVSHELRTPLASIAGFGETLQRYELSAEELDRVASLIRTEAQRLQEMVTVFLDLEKLGAGHWDNDAESIDFGELVAARLEVLQAAAEARGQDLVASFEGKCPIRGISTLLDRVVDNLVGNAVKYSCDDDRIEVSVRRSDETIVLTVRDHGPGIPQESLAHLFDRFYRVPGASSAGAGLGLALAKETVDWHGGCIDIQSEVGVGSAFIVSLPTLLED